MGKYFLLEGLAVGGNMLRLISERSDVGGLNTGGDIMRDRGFNRNP